MCREATGKPVQLWGLRLLGFFSCLDGVWYVEIAVLSYQRVDALRGASGEKVEQLDVLHVGGQILLGLESHDEADHLEFWSEKARQNDFERLPLILVLDNRLVPAVLNGVPGGQQAELCRLASEFEREWAHQAIAQACSPSLEVVRVLSRIFGRPCNRRDTHGHENHS